MKFRYKDILAMKNFRERIETSWLMLCMQHEDVTQALEDDMSAEQILGRLANGENPLTMLGGDATKNAILMAKATDMTMTLSYGHKLIYGIEQHGEDSDGVARLIRHVSISRNGKTVKKAIVEQVATAFQMTASESLVASASTRSVHMTAPWVGVEDS